MHDPSADYDGAWKNALDAYFPEFMALCWPDLHAQIDWRHPPVFLDKELQRLAVSARHGRLHIDKLAQVRLRNGQDLLTLIHTEIQGPNDTLLPARMFNYHIRLREKHPDQPVVSLAVLTHRRKGPPTQTYTYDHWGCTLTFRFPVINLESWRPRMPELLLLAPSNPFVVIVLAQLEVNAKHPRQEQFVRKKALIRRLYHWGFEHDQIMRLFNILDAMLILPESMEQDFAHTVSQIAEEHHMTYVNTIERVALRRERQEGRQEEAAEVLKAQLSRKFGALPDWVQTRLKEADKPTLNRWALQILDAQRIEDVFV